MVLSYSAIAKPTSTTPIVISIASSPAQLPSASSKSEPTKEIEQDAIAGPSKQPSLSSPSSITDSQSIHTPNNASGSTSSISAIEHLILDAGPLLSLTPLRHLATSFHTTPMVLAELRDAKAREHWERLGLSGVEVTVEHPSSQAMAAVTAFAKKTGDFAVLSQTDLSVAALAWQYEVKVNGLEGIRTEPGQKIKKPSKIIEEEGPAQEKNESDLQEQQADKQENVQEEQVEIDEESQDEEEDERVQIEEVTQSIEQVLLDSNNQSIEEEQPSSTNDEPVISEPTSTETPAQTMADDATPQDIEDESDGGEWINPSNLTTHRSRDLGLITPGGSAAKPPKVAAMTGDFAVQNILLGMGLGLVGEGGKRISKVKSFVLRCHACFKICKDSSKRFCPSCGNATLLRTTVSVDSKTGKQSLHLKKNFQYHLRGTQYSIPDPKMGRAKGQLKGGSGLILREDQQEWSDAVRSQDRERYKDEKRRAKGALQGWNDPDWLPEIITVGTSGKGRSNGNNMPSIGHGRKNPNQARRKR
ncbi:uncharacterized protein IL334_000177 [Kwoniella shivajii]|uniref:20S-pre-rRNA D-site endonuclease NOB1 n=1 Tax=Kwoniella shivajii TaxID=564305 RepID=A0ABZ1CPX5_9TREE|nr:hypothetical protein IL334_000177 [Kwoniella shivajii]